MDKSKTAHCNKLNKIVFNTSSNPNMVIIIANISVKNNIATSIAHVHSFNNPLKKILHQAINITLIEAELFTIRCGINQAVQIPSFFHTIIITNALYAAYKIFDFSTHFYQLQSVAISKDLWVFFNNHMGNFTEFWNYSSDKK